MIYASMLGSEDLYFYKNSIKKDSAHLSAKTTNDITMSTEKTATLTHKKYFRRCMISYYATWMK